MNDNIKSITLFLLMLAFVGCNTDTKISSMKTADELKVELQSKLQVGAQRKVVEKCLRDKSIEYSFVARENKIYAIVPKIGRYRIIYETSLLIRIQFDDNSRLTAFEFELEHSGL